MTDSVASHTRRSSTLSLASGNIRREDNEDESASRVARGTKRGREGLAKDHNPAPLSRAKLHPFNEGESTLLKRLAPPIELLRDDAFPLGHEARNHYEMDLISRLDEEELEEMGIDLQSKEQDSLCIVDLKSSQYKLVEKVAKEKSEKVASQLFELYQILERSHYTRKAEGRNILAFATQIIDKISGVESSDDEDESIDEEFQLLAENLLEKLPIDVTGNHTRQLALRLQKAAEGEEEDNSIQEEKAEIEELVSRRMGYLLLVAQHSIKLAVECVSSESFEEGLDQLADCVADIVEAAADRIQQHAEKHRNVSIQNSDEAAFHKMSIEMADLLLLDTGGINFGIIKDVAENLIPEHFSGTIAVENLERVLDDLQSNPQVWKTIAHIKPPKSKQNPSEPSIRACLGLSPNETITHRHARLFVLSAILGHMRQAKAGTCFTTACLIKALYHHLDYFVSDLKELTEEGYVSRSLIKEAKKFPFQFRLSKEYLDTIIEVEKDGTLKTTKKYELTPDEEHTWPKPYRGAALYDSPGIIAACQAVRIENVKEAVIDVIQQMPSKFVVADILRKLAEYAYEKQEKSLYHFRSQERCTSEQLLEKALFSFGAQTNHPLHRAYEQVTASMVIYFGSQYAMPTQVCQTMREILEKADRGHPPNFQSKYKRLLRETFLPMIIRARYRYNHHIDDTRKLFDDGNHGVSGNHFYGYELCDAGLPKDFEYSTCLLEELQQETSNISLERFREYSPSHTWKPVETEEKFRAFVQNIIIETMQHLESGASSEERKLWNLVADKMCADVAKPAFTKKMIHNILGRNSDQKKELKRNEFTIQTTPWLFRWGGDFNEVMKTYFGFLRSPSQLKAFNGTQKEVLAKCINFIKQQPDQIRRDLEDHFSQIIISAPVHAFLLLPHEESFQKAWSSPLSTNEYIEQIVERPGLEIANSRLSLTARNLLIDFVSKNMWVERSLEKDDWERQQLTERSKQIFDEKIRGTPALFQRTLADFEKTLCDIVIFSRAEDEKIGKRNTPWEQRFARVLHNLVKKLVPNERHWRLRIRPSVARSLIDFARDRVDTAALSDDSSAQFVAVMQKAPAGLSIKNFRQELVKAAYQAHYDDLYDQDKKWKESFCEHLDRKLFSLLPQRTQRKLIRSGIVTHDPNWKEGIHDFRTIFMVNPGTGRIEFCRYVPDLHKIIFESQKDWFPTGGKHGDWQFPDNYRSWRDAPVFNVKHYMDV